MTCIISIWDKEKLKTTTDQIGVPPPHLAVLFHMPPHMHLGWCSYHQVVFLATQLVAIKGFCKESSFHLAFKLSSY